MYHFTAHKALGTKVNSHPQENSPYSHISQQRCGMCTRNIHIHRAHSSKELVAARSANDLIKPRAHPHRPIRIELYMCGRRYTCIHIYTVSRGSLNTNKSLWRHRRCVPSSSLSLSSRLVHVFTDTYTRIHTRVRNERERQCRHLGFQSKRA